MSTRRSAIDVAIQVAVRAPAGFGVGNPASYGRTGAFVSWPAKPGVVVIIDPDRRAAWITSPGGDEVKVRLSGDYTRDALNIVEKLA